MIDEFHPRLGADQLTDEQRARFKTTDAQLIIARMYGFENITRTVPRGDQSGHLTEYQHARRRVRSALLGAGCDEIQPMPFLAPDDLSRAGVAFFQVNAILGLGLLAVGTVDVLW